MLITAQGKAQGDPTTGKINGKASKDRYVFWLTPHLFSKKIIKKKKWYHKVTVLLVLVTKHNMKEKYCRREKPVEFPYAFTFYQS